MLDLRTANLQAQNERATTSVKNWLQKMTRVQNWENALDSFRRPSHEIALSKHQIIPLVRVNFLEPSYDAE